MNGYSVIIDGNWGPASQAVLDQFEKNHGIEREDDATVALYLYRRQMVIPTRTPGGIYRLGIPLSADIAQRIPAAIAWAAFFHLDRNPREFGGENRGPWVRYYMEGQVGLPWCAGFVDTIVNEARQMVGQPVRPHDSTRWWWSSTAWLNRAKKDGRVLAAADVRRGNLFVVLKPGVTNLAVHIGIVVSRVRPDGTFLAIEGNGLPLDAKVLTPTGWSRIGDLCVGAAVVDPEGSASAVTGVYPQGVRPTFTLRFSDGSEVVSDEEHRWRFHVGTKNSAKTVVVTTAQASTMLRAGLFLPDIRPVEFAAPPPESRPIDPYLLGLILGNGGVTQQSAITFTSADSEVVGAVAALLPPGCSMVKQCATASCKPHHYRIIGTPIHSAMRDLGLAGRGSHTKHIPETYMMASPADRFAMLQGLMDTDGSVDRLGRIEFCSVSEKLARAVQFIVQSLGGKVAVYRKTGIKYTSPSQRTPKATGDAFVLRNIRLPRGMVPFRLPRKAARCRAERSFARGWRLESITLNKPMETVCISVSAASKLYLTENFIPTHNTNDEGSPEGFEVCLRTRAADGKAFFSA